MTTLHILANFDGPVTLSNRIDPFAIATYRFIEHMAPKGYHMIHYGAEGSNPPCENVIVEGDNAIQKNEHAGREIAARKKPGDLILCFYGLGNKIAADANQDLRIIEPAIGYDAASVFAPYRVFTSYAHQHMFYGRNNMLMNPSWFDAVIPNAFEVSEFEFKAEKQDYLLYFGRVIPSKGVQLAIQVAERTNHKLVIAGPGDLTDLGYPPGEIPSHVTMAGLCDPEKRRELMSNAKALLGPTYYVEPFGNMVVEAQLSGTPTITTDWGGFIETNPHGVTGFRCRDWKDFIFAVENIHNIDPHVCRRWAESRYSNEVVHQQFDNYMQKIIKLDFYAE